MLLFCVVIGGLADRLGRARARSPADLRRLSLLLGVVVLFLLANAVAASLLVLDPLCALLALRAALVGQRAHG